MTAYKFDPVKWKDDEDGGAVGNFYGTKITLEAHGHDDDPRWTIVFGNSQYGYERGGRDGERTLSDIKQIAEEDARHRAIRRYEDAKDTVAMFNAQHVENSEVYYVVRAYSHTDKRQLFKNEMRPQVRESAAREWCDFLNSEEADNKPPSKRHKFVVIKAEERI